MKQSIDELKSLASAYVGSGGCHYPEHIKKLAVAMSQSTPIMELSQQTGIAKTSLYKWKNQSTNNQTKPITSNKKDELRPIILQEIDRTQHLNTSSNIGVITISTANQVTVSLPATEQTIAIILNNLIGR